MNRYPTRHNTLRATALAVLLGVAAMGCANYSGDGNEFEVEGKVTKASEQSLTVDIYEIGETHGDANGWFEDGVSHKIHDNCECHGAWSGRKQYGEVRDYEGGVINPDEVAVGACVEVVGKIRSDKEGKSYTNRPVYDVAQLVPCG